MIEITNEQIERVNLLLGDIKGAPNRALFNVINRALGTVRSQSGKVIRETYNIKQSDITANQNMKMKRATAGDLVGSIEFAGTVIPLKRFKVSPPAPAQYRNGNRALRGGREAAGIGIRRRFGQIRCGRV